LPGARTKAKPCGRLSTRSHTSATVRRRTVATDSGLLLQKRKSALRNGHALSKRPKRRPRASIGKIFRRRRAWGHLGGPALQIAGLPSVRRLFLTHVVAVTRLIGVFAFRARIVSALGATGRRDATAALSNIRFTSICDVESLARNFALGRSPLSNRPMGGVPRRRLCTTRFVGGAGRGRRGRPNNFLTPGGTYSWQVALVSSEVRRSRARERGSFLRLGLIFSGTAER
jgi:hypothetical protein